MPKIVTETVKVESTTNTSAIDTMYDGFISAVLATKPLPADSDDFTVHIVLEPGDGAQATMNRVGRAMTRATEAIGKLPKNVRIHREYVGEDNRTVPASKRESDAVKISMRLEKTS